MSFLNRVFKARFSWVQPSLITAVRGTRWVLKRLAKSRPSRSPSAIRNRLKAEGCFYGPEHIRNHWQVENSLHWVLDVTFRQDDCRIRNGNAAANFATINNAAMNLLRRSPDKIRLPQKRCSAAWDDDYMEAIIRK